MNEKQKYSKNLNPKDPKQIYFQTQKYHKK